MNLEYLILIFFVNTICFPNGNAHEKQREISTSKDVSIIIDFDQDNSPQNTSKTLAFLNWKVKTLVVDIVKLSSSLVIPKVTKFDKSQHAWITDQSSRAHSYFRTDLNPKVSTNDFGKLEFILLNPRFSIFVSRCNQSQRFSEYTKIHPVEGKPFKLLSASFMHEFLTIKKATTNQSFKL